MIARSKTFRSGNSEALRLPKEMAFGENVELVLVRSGDVLTIYPALSSMQELARDLRALPPVPHLDREEIRPEPPERKNGW